MSYEFDNYTSDNYVSDIPYSMKFDPPPRAKEHIPYCSKNIMPGSICDQLGFSNEKSDFSQQPKSNFMTKVISPSNFMTKVISPQQTEKFEESSQSHFPTTITLSLNTYLFIILLLVILIFKTIDLYASNHQLLYLFEIQKITKT